MADIGKMALVLTANAGPLTQTLDSVEKKVKSTSKAVEKETSKGGGGGLSSLLSGAAIGGGIGAAAGAVMGAFSAVGDVLGGAVMGAGKLLMSIGSLREEAGKLGVIFSADVSKGIGHAANAIDSVKAGGMKLFGGIVAAAEPAITKIASVFNSLLERAAPVITWIADKVGTVLAYSFQAVAGVVEVLIGQFRAMWDTFASSAGMSEMMSGWATWGDFVKDAVKAIAKGFAYVWDTLKAGAGIAANMFGAVLGAIGKILEGWNALAGKLGMGKVSEGMIAGLNKVAVASQKVGLQMFQDWGKTAGAIDAALSGMSMEAEKAAAKPGVYQASAAIIAGSKEDYSIKAKFGMSGQMNPQLDVAKKQLAVEEKMERHLAEIKHMGPPKPAQVEVI